MDDDVWDRVAKVYETGQQNVLKDTEQYLDRIFDLHLLTQDQQDYLAEMRRQTKELARRMMELCPPNAERERAITLLDHALRDAIASVVRR